MFKVLSDPLYATVLDVLRRTREPLLDIGCGIGVLAFYLREHGWDLPCTGVDVDGDKIAVARRIQHQWPGALDFQTRNAADGLPEHSGSVTLLDVLQYLPREAQEKMLMNAAVRVSANGVLVIRNAMAGSCKRAAFTRATDKLAYWWGWMGTVPRDYPERSHIAQALATQGLQGTFEPLWGHSPYYNWLGVFRRTLPA
jgi:2-polyprenyl-3-methyl-5-hydroxy-6-metoxy-1,4-benzoquinol methylase